MGKIDIKSEELDLIAGIIGGRTDDFALIVDKYEGMVFRTCMGYQSHNPRVIIFSGCP
jgi:hypothetical protein